MDEDELYLGLDSSIFVPKKDHKNIRGFSEPIETYQDMDDIPDNAKKLLRKVTKEFVEDMGMDLFDKEM